MSLCKTAAWLAAAGIALLAPGCQPAQCGVERRRHGEPGNHEWDGFRT